MSPEQGTSAWRDLRKKGIGASEAAAVLGLCPYNTPMTVFMDKTGRAQAFEGNFATEKGQELEQKARSLFELLNMETFAPKLGVHPKYDFLRASFDGVSDDGKSILEIKCPSLETLSLAKEGKLPDHYMIQVQQQLLVSGAEKCFFFVYHDKSGDYATVEVLNNPDLQAKIVVGVENFWKNNGSESAFSTVQPFHRRDLYVERESPASFSHSAFVLVWFPIVTNKYFLFLAWALTSDHRQFSGE